MNSVPSRKTSGIVSGTTAMLTMSVVHFQRRAVRSTGSYTAMDAR